jgi:hypothetical protein
LTTLLIFAAMITTVKIIAEDLSLEEAVEVLAKNPDCSLYGRDVISGKRFVIEPGGIRQDGLLEGTMLSDRFDGIVLPDAPEFEFEQSQMIWSVREMKRT